MREFDYVVCNNCNSVHFEVSHKYVKDWLEDWEAFWPTLDQVGKDAYGLPDEPPTTASYYVCHRCGGSHLNFRDSTPEELAKIFGSTINPILERD